jgi:hypothetical protein
MSTVREKLDELIDWYDKYKPEAGFVLPVNATAETIKKFARQEHGKWFYRGREIVPTKKTEQRK